MGETRGACQGPMGHVLQSFLREVLGFCWDINENSWNLWITNYVICFSFRHF